MGTWGILGILLGGAALGAIILWAVMFFTSTDRSGGRRTVPQPPLLNNDLLVNIASRTDREARDMEERICSALRVEDTLRAESRTADNARLEAEGLNPPPAPANLDQLRKEAADAADRARTARRRTNELVILAQDLYPRHFPRG